jgi:hypothetical protein
MNDSLGFVSSPTPRPHSPETFENNSYRKLRISYLARKTSCYQTVELSRRINA